MEKKSMTPHDSISRRTVLQTGVGAAGTVLFGGSALIGQSASEDREAGLVSQIESHGHYAWFPLGPESWGRSSSPFDMQEGESRWLAQPTDDGGVRCLGRNLGTEPPNRNAGFDVHLGSLGEIETVTISSRTLQTPRTTSPAILILGLYLDIDDNKEFFTWETNDDGTESASGPGNDDEGLAFYGASGEVTIDGDTVFRLLNAETTATVAELQDGSVEGITGETAVALYIGVVNDGEGTDEVIVEDMSVQRS